MTSQTTVPSWLDSHFIEQALKEGEGNKIKVNNIQVQAATAPGDNYASVMYRVTAEYDTDGDRGTVCTKSLIVKAVPEDESLSKLMTENRAFTIEIEILGRIVPALHSLLNTSASGKPMYLAPRIYSFTSKPHQKLVMEDLCQSGFKMAPRLLGLDLDHSKLVLSQLAVFHAASIVLRSQQPEIFDNLLTHIYVQSKDYMRNFVTRSYDVLAEKALTWPGEGRRYSEKLLHLKSTAFKRLVKCVQRDDEGFNVLNHGDPWTNNMMFKYNDDGNVSDVIFLDFQCSYYGSPAIDLHYFVYTSPTPEVRDRHSEYLLECYHSSLSKTLLRLNYGGQCPSLDYFRAEMKNRNFMKILAAFCVKPFTSAKSDNTPDLTKLTEDASSGTSSAHLTEDYITDIQTLLPMFEKEGLLD